MILTTELGRIYRVTGNDRQAIDADLEQAVELVQRTAIKEGRGGVLLTRHGHSSFTVALSDQVPYGTTQEREDC